MRVGALLVPHAGRIVSVPSLGVFQHDTTDFLERGMGNGRGLNQPWPLARSGAFHLAYPADTQTPSLGPSSPLRARSRQGDGRLWAGWRSEEDA